MATYLTVVLAIITGYVAITIGAFALMTNTRFYKWMAKKLYKTAFEISKEMEAEIKKEFEEWL